MIFADFSKALENLEQTPSRLEMTKQLALLYRQLGKDEIEAAIYLMQGRLVPLYESLEFNLSTKMIQRALALLMERHQDTVVATTQTNLFGEENNDQFLEIVKNKSKQLGDIGLTAENTLEELQLKLTQVPQINEVFSDLKKIAGDDGQGSQDRKVLELVKLLERVNPLSARYITRIILGKVRLGFSTMTLLDALSWAVKSDKSDRVNLEEAYNKRADAGYLAKVYLAAVSAVDREQVLANYSVKNGVPVVPALAQRLNTTQEVIDKMTQVLVEPKYDGLRVQIHFQQGQPTKAYTRNLDDVSHMFPELATADQALSCQSCILDGEAIGYDPHTGNLLAFQQTITRRRKHGVDDQAAIVPLRFYLFDVLEVDGQPLIDKPLLERKKKIAEILVDNQAFKNTTYIQSTDPDEIRQYHQQQLDDDLEGAIFKKIDSSYRGGRKGWRWVKMKEVEGTTGKLSDTLDCVVMGYYLGKGKRAEFGLGAILVGVRDEKNEAIKTITKIGTGLTDEQLQEMKSRIDVVATTTKPKNYDVPKGFTPDVWANPEVVIEVAADEITNSPSHSAGVALRFPRLIGFRDDKDWQSATSLDEVGQIKIK
ncbi:MAG: ATP-dependent DNA ligase [Candidatus Pacebacteria bacterium]|jgi:DNA ligase 1|nr:ATP-dependent DNA ligase [Candidatus Paceibacterota bacterium]MBT3511889.1 ATP-dependent DNA ligase [Candidatus Paceibacterota bacterium]MBT4005379.1 ATP-dependent DNA ligase [Candidatus Paceibacterota bacterium]MBT4359305.1 ATP-dependent DNA ligase [Candidatus Paceibacterota bacterium]MBT4681310.1 ATP-dependent DNA ligase [Candidatus Paceibacterota bacterium]